MILEGFIVTAKGLGLLKEMGVFEKFSSRVEHTDLCLREISLGWPLDQLKRVKQGGQL